MKTTFGTKIWKHKEFNYNHLIKKKEYERKTIYPPTPSSRPF